MAATVSVIIPTWNRGELLEECLESLREQRRRADEVIVVDNGSRDGTAEMLASKFPEVKTIALESNEGFSKAVNHGLRAAKGDLIALLNNDTACDPGWLGALTAAAGAHPEAGVFASRVVMYDDPETIDSAGDSYTRWGMVTNRGHGERGADRHAEMAEVFGACAAAAMYRAAVIKDVGLIDENFFAYYEDVEWSFRARLLGHRCLYVPDAVVRHRYGATSPAGSKLGREEVYLHLTGIVVKNMPGALIIKNLPALAIFHSAVLLFYIAARLQGGARLPRVPFFRFMSAMLRGRREVKRKRRVHWKEIEKAFAKTGFFEWFRREWRNFRG